MIAAIALGALADSGGAWWVFAFSACQAIGALFWENLQLRERIKPKLELVFKPESGSPFVRDKSWNHKSTGARLGTLRIFSVGVTNAGDSANAVSVRLDRIEPAELEAYWGAALHVAQKKVRVSKRDLHHSPNSAAGHFEVISQVFDANEPADLLMVRFAGKALFHKQLSGKDKYFITLRIDGQGAGRPVRYVLMRDELGHYEMRPAAMQIVVEGVEIATT